MTARPLVVAALVAAATALLPCCTIELHGGDRSFLVGDPKATRTDESELPLVRGGRLELSEGDGNVVVHVGSGPARMVARWRGYGKDAAAAEAALAQARVESSGDAARVTVHFVRGEHVDGQGVVADVELWLPEVPDLGLTTSSGDITVDGTIASGTLITSFGDIELRGCAGNLRATTSSGSITLSEVAGDVDAESSFGDVKLDRCRGPRIVARTSSGTITCLDGGEATFTLASSFGDVVLRGGTGTLEVDTRSGRIEVERFSGALAAKNGFGSIVLDGRFTTVDAETSSGDVSLRCSELARERGAWRLVSRFGDVELEAPAALAGDLAASTRFGKVDCLFGVGPESERVRGERIERKLHGGGAPIELATDSGDVRFRTSAP